MYALNESIGVSGFDSLAHEAIRKAIMKRELRNRKRMVRHFAICVSYALKQKVYPNERSVRNEWNAKK